MKLCDSAVNTPFLKESTEGFLINVTGRMFHYFSDTCENCRKQNVDYVKISYEAQTIRISNSSSFTSYKTAVTYVLKIPTTHFNITF